MTPSSEQDLWSFAVELYDRPGVQAACLDLQDNGGVDVLVLLLAAWLTKYGVALNAQDLPRIDDLVAEWRADIVYPLRATRRRLKVGPHPAPSEQTETLRDAVKRSELLAEKVQLAVLETEGRRLLATRPHGAAANNLAIVQRYFGPAASLSARASLDVIQAAIAAGDPAP